MTATAETQAARSALEEIRANLAKRPPEANLWDNSTPDEREHLLRESHNRRIETENRLLVPGLNLALARYPWDQLSERGRAAAGVACRPIVQWAESIADGGGIVDL